ncbi:cytoplasmic protein [Aminobacter sp. Piv2-1]|uniref:cytoplasmic protein n=1 Tax=Aminobacter sp. Piv2-1 TaxID=3031122 RepID=UPI0030B5B60A
MRDFRNEITAFRQDKLAELADARQRAALQICCGIELADALSGGFVSTHALLRRLERVIERERLKGVNRHWSYDLNRHIALKQVRDRLKGVSPAEPARLTFRPRRRRQKSKAAPEGAAH